jgi:lysophospholipase L1-like esterase
MIDNAHRELGHGSDVGGPKAAGVFRIACQRGLLLAAGLLIACLLAEVGLRLATIRFDASLFTPDPDLGWALRPNAEGWNMSDGEEYIRINSDGIRDKERRVPKPPHSFRIAVLGDSVTEAIQVTLEDTFPSRLERQLAHCPSMQGRTVEVLNFGVAGYGTTQELLMLRGKVRKYQPDLVLLEFYFGNDLSDNFRELDYTKPGGRPYFVEKDGRLVLDDSFQHLPEMQPGAIRLHNWLADLMNHSRLLLLLESAKTKLHNIRGETAPKRDPLLPENYIQTVMYVPPRSPYAVQTWRVTEGVLPMLRDEARSQGAGFLLLDIPMSMQISADRQRQQDFMRKAGIDTLYYPNQRLESFAQQHGIPYLSLLNPAANYVLQHHQSVTVSAGHFNEVGHRIVADVLYDYVCNRVDQLLGHPISTNRLESSMKSPSQHRGQ